MAEGAIWTLLEKLGAQAVSFVVFIVIARFIGPEEYGLVSLCYIYLALAYTLFSSIVDGVINLHICDDLRLSSLFWGIAAGGFFLSLACFASANLFAEVMGQPRLVLLLRWFSVLPVLFALASVPTVIVTNSMNFRIFAIRTIVATILSGIVGIGMAVRGFGAYAIVAQQTVLYAVINIIIWPGSGWRPRYMFSLDALMDILKPGIKMSGSLFISFFEQQLPRLMIGHFLGAEAVGHFSFITRICQSLQEVLVYPLSMVSYPAFTRLMNDRGEQKKILSQLIMLSGAVFFPCVSWAAVTAPVYVPLFFGMKWVPAVTALQMFLISMACLPLITILRDCLRAHNRMGEYLKMQGLLTAGSFCLIWELVPHGLVFMMYGIMALYFLSVPTYIRLTRRIIKIGVWYDVMRLWGAALSSAAMAVTVYVFNWSSYRPESSWQLLFMDTILAAAVYVAAYSVLQFRQMKLLAGFLKEGLLQRIGQKEQAAMQKETITHDLL